MSWQVNDGTTTVGQDYQAAGGKLTFPVGATSGMLEVNLMDDNLFEQSLETFTVDLIDQGTRLSTLSPTEASFEASIRDNESLTTSITANAEMAAEGNDTTFTVTLTGGVPADAVTVAFEAAGTATAVDDYDAPIGAITFPPGSVSGKTGVLEIPAGQLSGTITYPIVADNAEEDEETLDVEIFNAASSVRTASVSQTESLASVTILDQGSLTVSIQGAPSADEGTAATFTIVMSTASDEYVSVDWATKQAEKVPGGSPAAEEDVDYAAASGTVAITAGSTSATFTVSTTQDTLAEGDETFQVVLEEARITSSSPPEMVPLGVTAATGTIVDDDTAPDGLTVTVTPNRVSKDDGATDLTITVTLDGTVQFTVDTPVTVEMVNWPNVNRNATLGLDYTATISNVNIPAGQSSVTTTITLNPVDDNFSEENEVARLTAKSSALSGSDALGVTIEDNDVEPGEVELTVTPNTVNESASTLQLTVTGSLVGQSSREIDTVVSLELADDDATVGDDFQAATASLIIPAGGMNATVTMTLTILDDNIAEGDEALTVTGTVPGTILVNPAEVIIEDDDLEPNGIGISVTAAPLDEASAAATIPVRATLLGGGTRSVDTEVALSIADLTATVDDDYLEGNSTLASDVEISVTVEGNTSGTQRYGSHLLDPLRIEAGESSATALLTLTGKDDDIEDEDEVLEIKGTTDTPGLTINSARLVITNDDTSGVRVSPTSLTIREGQRKYYGVDLTSEPIGNVVVTVDVPAGAGFTVNPGILTFTPQSWGVKYVNVRATEDLDGDDEPAADITHSLDSIDTKYHGANTDDVTITVRDTVSASVVVAPTGLSLDEGASGSYTVLLDTVPTGDVTITIGGNSGTSVTVDQSTLTFTTLNWNTSQTVVVTAGQDDNAISETVTLTNTPSGGGYDGVTADSVVVTVTDYDTAGVTISETTLTIQEGDAGTYTVVLDTQPAGDVTVTVGGADGTDLSVDKTVLTFTDQDWDAAQTVTVTAVDDHLDEEEETATITHTVASVDDSDYEGASAGSVAVTITDNDSARVTISETDLEIEEGASDTYTVVLDTEPTGDVAVIIRGVTDTDLTLDKTTLTFTHQNWNTPQTVTVTAEQDDDAVDESVVTITHTVTSTADTDYDGVTAASVAVTVTDDAPKT